MRPVACRKLVLCSSCAAAVSCILSHVSGRQLTNCPAPPGVVAFLRFLAFDALERTATWHENSSVTVDLVRGRPGRASRPVDIDAAARNLADGRSWNVIRRLLAERGIAGIHLHCKQWRCSTKRLSHVQTPSHRTSLDTRSSFSVSYIGKIVGKSDQDTLCFVIWQEAKLSL